MEAVNDNIIKLKPKKYRNISLSQTFQDIMRPLFLKQTLTWSEWCNETGYGIRNGGFAYYANRLIYNKMVEKEKFGRYYSITEKGIMLYCAMVDKPIEHFIEVRARELKTISLELNRLRERIKRFSKI